MTAKIFKDDILFYQRLLCVSDLYTGKLDGCWGHGTAMADEAFDKQTQALQQELGSFDNRTEDNIGLLTLQGQRAARSFMAIATTDEFTCKIISSTRTYAQQDALYEQGRDGHPGPIVTNARGGYSNHNFGIAWDIGLFDANGRYLDGSKKTDEPAYVELSHRISSLGLIWGGSWARFPDEPHYQISTGLTITEMRTCFESGTLKVHYP